MKEDIERRRAEAAEKKKQKEESKEGSKAPFIAPKGASAKVTDSLTYSKCHFFEHGTIVILCYTICIFFLTDWRKSRISEQICSKKVRSVFTQQSNKYWGLACTEFILLFIYTSPVKTSHTPLVCKIGNRLEQYTSAVQVRNCKH